MAQTKGKKSGTPPASVTRLSGPRARFRHKVRSPVSLLLTQQGHDRMQQELTRTGLSRSDYFETLLHEHGHEVRPIQAGELAKAAGQ